MDYGIWDTVQEQARAAEAKQKAKAQKERLIAHLPLRCGAGIV